MIEVIIFLALGISLGYFVRKKPPLLAVCGRLAGISVLLLLFLLGVSLGANDEVLALLPKLGGYAFILAVLSIIGSVILAAILYRKMFKKAEKEHEE